MREKAPDLLPENDLAETPFPKVWRPPSLTLAPRLHCVLVMQAKKLLHGFPNMSRDTAGDMTCASMLHLFDYPAAEKGSPYSRAQWRPKAGPGEGEELGAVFDLEKLSRPLLEAIQQYAREEAASGKSNPALNLTMQFSHRTPPSSSPGGMVTTWRAADAAAAAGGRGGRGGDEESRGDEEIRQQERRVRNRSLEVGERHGLRVGGRWIGGKGQEEGPPRADRCAGVAPPRS